MNIVGENIRENRKRAGISQEELAQKIFTTRQTVSNYENGKSNPDMETLTKIAEVLNVKPDTLIYEDDAVVRRRKGWWSIAACVLSVIALYSINMYWTSGQTVSGVNQGAYRILNYVTYGIVFPVMFFGIGWFLVSAILSFVQKDRIAFKPNKVLFWISLGVLALYLVITGILIGKEVRVIRLSQNYSVYSSVLQIPMSEYYPRAVHKIIWWVTRFYVVIWFTVLGFFAGLWKPVKKKDA
ncbi:MAG: helix-turn-helix transcriptional regulator [Erysipelotrichales bacterium]|nr:helix-turn-helix transcriptional regulator [Erysipelotrichales bacterium]MBQ4375493.1 helix-turn-helix transcriptional regulator [Erysipelotrichales bacterium]MBQ5543079.1 helix-turn-helix transcriptional regulator [Erysipelotrichales bacterium]